MKTSELVAAVAKDVGMPKSKVDRVLRSILRVSKDALMSGEGVTLLSFGAFYVLTQKKRTVFGDATRQTGRRIIRFKEAKLWRSTASSPTTRRPRPAPPASAVPSAAEP